MTGALLLEGALVVTVDGAGTEHAAGHVVVQGNRITAVAAGRRPTTYAGTPPSWSTRPAAC